MERKASRTGGVIWFNTSQMEIKTRKGWRVSCFMGQTVIDTESGKINLKGRYYCSDQKLCNSSVKG